jgi:glycosyltransferase involved in cell wall biosynthesis
MRICFFPGALHAGGIARNSINLAQEFVAQGYEVDFFLTYREGDLLDSIPSGVRVFASESSAKRSLLSFVKYLRKAKPDVVLSARDYLNIVAYLGVKISGVKCQHIATIRTSTFTERGQNAPFSTRLTNWLATEVYKRTDHVVAVSESVVKEETSRRGLRDGLIKKIYNPVVPPSLLDYEIIEGYERRGGVFQLCAVGRLTKQKDFSTLLKAARILKDEGFLFHLSIIGHGELLEDLVSESDSLGLVGWVEFKGALPSAWEEIRNADLLVQSSLWEGLPTVLIEALALGTNIVATDCPGGAAEILEHGSFGFLAEPGNPTSLASAIISAYDNPICANRLRGRALDFTAEKAMRNYEELFLS